MSYLLSPTSYAHIGAVQWYCNAGMAASKPNATYVMMSGGGMTHYTTHQLPPTPFVTGGLQVIGLSFDDDWEITPSTNPEPIKASASRPATGLSSE